MANDVVQKKTIAQFVHDAVEMEAAIYTLDEMEKECIKKKKQIIDNAACELQKSKNELYEKEKNLSDSQDRLIASRSEHQKNLLAKLFTSIVTFFFVLFYALIPSAVFYFVVGIVIYVINYNGGSIDSFTVLKVLCVIELIALAIFSVFSNILTDKENTEQIKKVDEECKQASREVANSKTKVRISKDNYNRTQHHVSVIELQIEDIRFKRKQIQDNLSNFYNYGIIPPDYRTFDCVMMLDQIFRNDLADTMRDAIKIYEERVFRGSVIRGMDKICSMLGQLSSEMSAISLRLDMINSSVTQMGDDLLKTSQRLMNNQRELIDESIKNRAATEELINETKLGRYATEKLLESNKLRDYYIEEYRMGRMPRD